MSQQGPGGYGGPPPGGHGGWGPPGGQGYGAPPGAPPGGHPPPPGQPPGWGQPQPPPHHPPGPAAGGRPAVPPKKSNTGLLLGIGCGVLLLAGAVAAAGIYFYVIKPAQELKAAVDSAAGSLGATVSVSDGGLVVAAPGVEANITDAGIVVQTPQGAANISPDGGVTLQTPQGAVTVPPSVLKGIGGTGGAVCEQAAACCRAVTAKTGANASALAGCAAMTSLPTVGCEQALATYKRTASAVGASCP